MGYKRGADGIVKKGKTEGKNLGDSGPTQAIQKGGKKSGGVSSMEMKKVGRNLARANLQKKG